MVLDHISLTVRENEFLTLLGPSGCGKTTLLRIIAGLETTDKGEVWLDGADITKLPPYQRSVNTVFQSYALFPHMTVAQNVAFGLSMKRQPKAAIHITVQETLKLVHMEDYAHRFPDQLSGGQQQRVALARALVNHPKVLLLDESLSALDCKLRKQMQIELKHLQRNTGITFIFVTHDQDEALSMSDRVAVMESGYIAQLGTPQEIYHSPQSRFVANFIGHCNFIKADTIGLEGVDVGFRPEAVSIGKESTPAIGSALGCLQHISYHGPTTHYLILLDSGEAVTVAQERCEQMSVGDRLSLRPHPERLIRCRH